MATRPKIYKITTPIESKKTVNRFSFRNIAIGLGALAGIGGFFHFPGGKTPELSKPLAPISAPKLPESELVTPVQERTVKFTEPFVIEENPAFKDDSILLGKLKTPLKLFEKGKELDHSALSLVVHDLDKDERILDYHFNRQGTKLPAESGQVLKAASLVKPFVAIAAYDRLAQGVKVPSGLDLEGNIRKMITESDNPATNRVINFVLGADLPQGSTLSDSQSREFGEILKRHGFSQTSVVENIPVGDYAVDGKTYRNKTSSADLVKLIQGIHARKIGDLPRKYVDLLRGHMDGYTTTHLRKIRGSIFPRVNLTGKTGFVHGLNGEATLVTTKDKEGKLKHYAFVIMMDQDHEERSDPNAWRVRSQDFLKAAFLKIHRHVTGYPEKEDVVKKVKRVKAKPATPKVDKFRLLRERRLSP